jgi:hypothetical protein
LATSQGINDSNILPFHKMYQYYPHYPPRPLPKIRKRQLQKKMMFIKNESPRNEDGTTGSSPAKCQNH